MVASWAFLPTIKFARSRSSKQMGDRRECEECPKLRTRISLGAMSFSRRITPRSANFTYEIKPQEFYIFKSTKETLPINAFLKDFANLDRNHLIVIFASRLHEIVKRSCHIFRFVFN